MAERKETRKQMYERMVNREFRGLNPNYINGGESFYKESSQVIFPRRLRKLTIEEIKSRGKS